MQHLAYPHPVTHPHTAHVHLEPGAGSRRELHKSATRQALIDAAYALAGEHGVTAVTAEGVAARAGVSRRTFFNYFPTVEAAFAAPIETFLERGRDLLAARPADEPILQAAAAVFPSVADDDLLSYIVQLTHMGAPVQHATWLTAEVGLSQVLCERLQCSDQLYVATLAATLLGALRAGVLDWAARHTGPIDAACLTDLTTTMNRTLDLLSRGFVQED